MELRELLIFVRVAEDGDFSAAARTLEMTPSAVSKAVARLESHLGRRLLQRSSRASTLTAEGHHFLEAAKQVLDAAREAEAVVSGPPRGLLRIRSIPSFAVHQLAPLMPAFQKRYPDITLDFVLGTERSASLDDGADVAITQGLLPSSSLVARRLGETRWICCASPGFLAAHGPAASVAELANFGSLSFSAANQWTALPGAQPPPSTNRQANITGNHGDMLLAMARAGAGVVRMSEYLVSADLAAGRLVALPDALQDPAAEPIWLLYHERKHLSPRISAFIAFAEAAFAHSPWRARTANE